MRDIDIEKKANGYIIEIRGNYDDVEDEVYLYKTREEMEADLVNIVERAHVMSAEIAAKKTAKEVK